MNNENNIGGFNNQQNTNNQNEFNNNLNNFNSNVNGEFVSDGSFQTVDSNMYGQVNNSNQFNSGVNNTYSSYNDNNMNSQVSNSNINMNQQNMQPNQNINGMNTMNTQPNNYGNQHVTNNGSNKNGNGKVVVLIILGVIIAALAVVITILVLNRKDTTDNNYENNNVTDSTSNSSDGSNSSNSTDTTSNTNNDSNSNSGATTIDYDGFTFTQVPGYTYSIESDGLRALSSNEVHFVQPYYLDFSMFLANIDEFKSGYISSGYTIGEVKSGSDAISFEMTMDGYDMMFYILPSNSSGYSFMVASANSSYTHDSNLLNKAKSIVAKAKRSTDSSSSFSSKSDNINDVIKSSSIEFKDLFNN